MPPSWLDPNIGLLPAVIVPVFIEFTGLQSIAQDVSDNVSHPCRLDPTMEVITYSFVLYLQRGCHEVICKPSIVLIVQFLISVLPSQNIILVNFTNENLQSLITFSSVIQVVSTKNSSNFSSGDYSELELLSLFGILKKFLQSESLIYYLNMSSPSCCIENTKFYTHTPLLFAAIYNTTRPLVLYTLHESQIILTPEIFFSFQNNRNPTLEYSLFSIN